ncbi:MAG: hypothetical protein IJZ47_09790 [Oscillospiraceae bacterium]|nr:hypothetical protein [Oscillospiraceae bacterium]
MKKAYFAPEIEISVFATEDIITVSGTVTTTVSDPTPLSDSQYDTTYTDLFN